MAALVSTFGSLFRSPAVSHLDGGCRPLLPAPNGRLIFSLFLAIAMAISAVPVIAKILIDLDLLRRELGLLILAAGILDDSIGWLLLSIVAGLAARGTIDLHGLLVILA